MYTPFLTRPYKYGIGYLFSLSYYHLLDYGNNYVSRELLKSIIFNENYFGIFSGYRRMAEAIVGPVQNLQLQGN
jgi:hypothetical protein